DWLPSLRPKPQECASASKFLFNAPNADNRPPSPSILRKAVLCTVDRVSSPVGQITLMALQTPKSRPRHQTRPQKKKRRRAVSSTPLSGRGIALPKEKALCASPLS